MQWVVGDVDFIKQVIISIANWFLDGKDCIRKTLPHSLAEASGLDIYYRREEANVSGDGIRRDRQRVNPEPRTSTHPAVTILRQLKRSGASIEDLLCFYKTVVRPVLEYACPVWHSSLTKGQTMESWVASEASDAHHLQPRRLPGSHHHRRHRHPANPPRNPVSQIFPQQHPGQYILPTLLTSSQTWHWNYCETPSSHNIWNHPGSNCQIPKILYPILFDKLPIVWNITSLSWFLSDVTIDLFVPSVWLLGLQYLH